jgi:hypothetical protein
LHIVENHDEMAGYYEETLSVIEDPQWVLRGYGGTLIAARSFGRRRYLAVVYREVSQDDGFVITAYLSSRLNRSAIVWSADR